MAEVDRRLQTFEQNARFMAECSLFLSICRSPRCFSSSSGISLFLSFLVPVTSVTLSHPHQMPHTAQPQRPFCRPSQETSAKWQPASHTSCVDGWMDGRMDVCSRKRD
uniref:Uncharacterized protein n=1 Tax=Vitrella brassicaformis TaxID=1169539 RepID=A0A7S1JST8_9ALVE